MKTVHRFLSTPDNADYVITRPVRPAGQRVPQVAK
jgi:hypothetical protein